MINDEINKLNFTLSFKPKLFENEKIPTISAPRSGERDAIIRSKASHGAGERV